MTVALIYVGQYEKAQVLNSEHSTLAAKLLEMEPTNEYLRKQLLATMNNAGWLLQRQRRTAEWLLVQQQQLRQVRGFMERGSLDPTQRAAWNAVLLDAIAGLTLAQREAGRLKQALESSREGLALASSMARRDPDSDALRAIRDIHYNVGQVLEQMGQWGPARREYEIASGASDQMKSDVKDLLARSRIARSLAYLGQRDESVAMLRAVLLQAEVQMEARKNLDSAETVAMQYERLGEVYMLAEVRALDAVASLGKGDEVLSGFLDETTKAVIGPRLVGIRCGLAEALLAAGQSGQATHVLESARQLLDKLAAGQGSESVWVVSSMRMQHVRGQLELVLGNVALADKALQAAAQLANALLKASPEDAMVRDRLTRIDQDLRKIRSTVETR